MFAELCVVLEALEGFLGGTLVRLLFAVAHGVAGIDAAQDDGGAEYGVLVGVAVRVNEFKLDGHPILLGPLDEARLEVLLGLDQVVEVKMALDQSFDDETAATAVALVEIDGAHEGLEGIAAQVAVV